MFSISIMQGEGERGAPGQGGEVGAQIQVGDFHESFRMPVGYWTPEDYERSWCQAFTQLDHAEVSTSCLMTAMTEPRKSNFLKCWPLYRFQETVYVQNSIIFLDELDEEFDPARPWNSVLPHSSVDEDGNRISEWPISFSTVKDFFDTFCGTRR